jgi:hypothetical protein
MPIHVIRDRNDIAAMRKIIANATTNGSKAIGELIGSAPAIAILAQMKFHELGYHPVEDRRLNLIEQVNQTFTYLVSLAAAEQLLTRHPGSAPIILNLGTSSGNDLESESQSIAAEVFAAVRRTNNRKLQKDVAKVADAPAKHKYVFFYCPGEECTPFRLERFPDVGIVPLSELQVWGDFPNV